MAKEKNQKEKPLTLSQLTGELSKYSHEVLFPYMDENFAGKKEFKKFKIENFTGQDKILKKLDILLGEKEIKEAQEKRQKKVIEIHNDALKRNKILSAEEVLRIDQMGAF